MKTKALSIYEFLGLLVRENPTKIYLTLGCVMAAEGLDAAGFALLLPLIKAFTGQPGTGFVSVRWILFFVVLAFAAKNLFTYIFKIYSEKVATQFEEETRRNIISANFESQLDFHLNEKIGALLSAVSNHAANSSHAFRSLIQLAAGIINVSVFCVVGLWLSWKMFLLSTIGGLISFILLRKVIRLSRQVARKAIDLKNECQGSVIEDLSAIKFIKGNRLEQPRKKGLFVFFAALRDAELTKHRYLAIVDTLPDFIVTSLMCVVFYVSYTYFQVPGANILVLSAVLYQMNRRILALQVARQKLVTHLPSVEFCMAIIEKARGLKEETGSRPVDQLKEGIEFDRVSFSFGREPVLQEITFTARKDELTALVGKSGSGKTTILDLVMGLFRPKTGSIRIDGIEMGELNVFSWREKISYVPQEPVLFNGSIMDNILMGRPAAGADEVWEAARRAHADEFIERMPAKYDTLVGDRGTKLSGGQRQRIALARALLRKPQLLILDEATSALDNESERMVRAALNELRGSITILVVAHRLTTIENADVIYVLDQGRIVESGSAESLASDRRVFHALYGANPAV